MKAKGWRALKNLIDPVKLKAAVICMEANPPKMPDKYTIECRYNSRLDLDNVSAHCKVIIDQLVSMGVLKDDSKKYWRGFSITPDESMNNNSLTLKVTEA